MKVWSPFVFILFMLLSACTEKIDLAPVLKNDSTVIIFHVSIPESPDYNTLFVYDNYDHFRRDTLPTAEIRGIDLEHNSSRTKHTLVCPKEPGKELWFRVNSSYFHPWHDENFVYQSSVFIPYSDSLIIDSVYENWIQE